MFVDRAILMIRAGKGGDGKVSFRREKYIPKGGPDGGNGGDGGSVIAQEEPGAHTLLDFHGLHHWEAKDGEAGGASQCSGLKGEDSVMRLPAGTLIYDDATGELIHDLKPGERVVIAKGGRGGFGNEHFKRSTNQTPRQAEPGEPGESRRLRLELKLIADVGIVGLPNAGKSTLLAAVTKATPKIADYPFTTLSPQLGIAELDPPMGHGRSGGRRVVLADIPGLIEGAAGGAGLGHDFLRHIERTRVLVHLLDAAPADGSDPAENYAVVRKELSAYSELLAEKPEIICLSKMDLLPDEEERKERVAELRGKLRLGGREPLLALSAATREGTKELLEKLWAMLNPKGEKVGAGWSGAAAAESK